MPSIATDESKLFLEQLSEAGETIVRPAFALALRLSTANWERLDPPWWLVRATVQACVGVTDGGYGNCCVLSQTDQNTYVQTAFAPKVGIAWRLEWRITQDDGSYAHYFATAPGDDSGVVYQIEQVIASFEAFYRGEGLPTGLQWMIYDV